MSKVLDATCLAGIVKVGALPIPGTTVLSEGVSASTGVLILEEDKKTYIPKTSPDLKTTLTDLGSVLNTIAGSVTQIATALTSIGANMTGPTTAPPPTLAADVAILTANVVSINLIRTQILLLKDTLK